MPVLQSDTARRYRVVFFTLMVKLLFLISNENVCCQVLINNIYQAIYELWRGIMSEWCYFIVYSPTSIDFFIFVFFKKFVHPKQNKRNKIEVD